MSAPLVKLNEHINQIVIWLRDNPGIRVFASQKDHLISLLNKLINGEALSDEEVRLVKESIEERTLISAPSYMVCRNCGDRFNRRDTEKHKSKCIGYKNLPKSTIQNTPPKRKGSNIGRYQVTPCTTSQRKTSAESREERKLDGAKDCYTIRDNGKFGSYPTYDDMGDESFS